MAETTNNLGYNTYITGTAKNITDCLEIILYNKSELTVEDGVDSINIYNIQDVIRQLRAANKCISISRSSNTDYFQYYMDNGIISGFNVVIYLQNGTGTGIGYTEFINLQGKYRNIAITLDSKTEVEGTLEINVSNSLVLANSDGSREWIGDGGNNYTSGKRISGWKVKKEDSLLSPTGYTTHLSGLGNSLFSEVNLWLGGLGVVRGETESLYTLTVARDFDFDPYETGFSNSFIGWYDPTDISHYLWEGLRYTIVSISQVNRFGSPLRHTDTEKGWDEVIGIDSSRYTIIGWEGKYGILQDTLTPDRRVVWDTVDKKIIGTGKIFIDGDSPHYDMVTLPTVSYATNIIMDVPDLGNTFFDIETWGRSNQINIAFRKGPWFVFRQGDLAVWSSLRMSLTTSWKEISRTQILSDSYIGVMSEDKSCFTVYTGIGENWLSEEARSIRGMTADETSRYEKAYIDGKIIDCIGNLGETWLMNFRRNIYPLTGFPEVGSIVGAVSGLVFYNNNGKMNYL